ncbi:unnamed protein product [Rotaria magnacalcarata]|nr:unnamed protein product [Rotaria magnacalcarata]
MVGLKKLNLIFDCNIVVKKNFIKQIKSIVLYILWILAPNDVEAVWNDLIDSENENKKNIDDYHVIMEALAEAYSNSHQWSTRHQFLSIVAGDSRFHSIQQFIPDLTRSRFNEARHQAKVNGYGTIVETGRSPTIRFTNNQVNHFIEYILSPHITSNARRLDSLDPRLYVVLFRYPSRRI